MENASKALLIAGAILIAILLIAIGMKVFNSASGVVNSAGTSMSSQEKTMFNRQWEMYNGKQSGSTIKQMLNDVTANNSDSENEKISVEYENTSEGNIKNAANYTVSTEDVDKNGLIDKITITGTETTSGGGTPAA